MRRIASHARQVALLGVRRLLQPLIGQRQARPRSYRLIVYIALKPVIHRLNLLVVLGVLALRPSSPVLVDLVE